MGAITSPQDGAGFKGEPAGRGRRPAGEPVCVSRGGRAAIAAPRMSPIAPRRPGRCDDTLAHSSIIIFLEMSLTMKTKPENSGRSQQAGPSLEGTRGPTGPCRPRPRRGPKPTGPLGPKPAAGAREAGLGTSAASGPSVRGPGGSSPTRSPSMHPMKGTIAWVALAGPLSGPGQAGCAHRLAIQKAANAVTVQWATRGPGPQPLRRRGREASPRHGSTGVPSLGRDPLGAWLP